MANRKQPTPPPDVSQKPQPPPKPPERRRTAVEFIRELLRVGQWYYSAIELDPYVESPQDGGSLRREAEEIVAHDPPPLSGQQILEDVLELARTSKSDEEAYGPYDAKRLGFLRGEAARCDTCDWYRADRSEENPHGGICALGSWIAWNEPKPLRPPAHQNALAHGTGDLMVSLDFGCVQWEGKQ